MHLNGAGAGRVIKLLSFVNEVESAINGELFELKRRI